ncbi:MAG: hypothetical protein AAGA64_14455 [Bacteroidota bacterium]
MKFTERTGSRDMDFEVFANVFHLEHAVKIQLTPKDRHSQRRRESCPYQRLTLSKFPDPGEE